MQERDSQESWLSLRKIQEIMGMSQPTIIKWQRYLKENGWLVETGETAADKYSNPTPGAHKVPVVRVDDGAKVSLPPKGGAKVSLPPQTLAKLLLLVLLMLLLPSLVAAISLIQNLAQG
jgi:hypothetical protein